MVKKSICIVVFACVLFAVVSSQAGYLPPNPITAPTVTAPAMTPMPTIGLPTVIAPTVSGSGIISGGTASKTSTGTSGSTGKTSPAAPSSTAATALSLLGLGSNNSLLSALNGTGTDDASTSALSGLLGNGTTSTTDSATLNRVLELLEKQQATADATAKKSTAAGSAAATGEKTPVASGGELIRFTVNGYSITATTLVSSILAKDGSFLLTGDRGSPSSAQKIAETFYLLCRKNADGTYRLHADVSQTPVNVNSYLYQLARRSPIKGTLTGDLLVFRTDDPAWSLNLVIRIISPSVVKTSVR